MAKFKLAAGADIEMLTKDELAAELAHGAAAARAPYQAASFIYLPVIIGQAAGGVLALGGDSQPLHTPDAGYVWAVMHLSIEGLAAGDVVNVIRGGRRFWQIAQTPPSAASWTRGAFMLRHGMTLSYTNFGTFTSTAQIEISGTAWNLPEQFAAELVL